MTITIDDWYGRVTLKKLKYSALVLHHRSFDTLRDPRSLESDDFTRVDFGGMEDNTLLKTVVNKTMVRDVLKIVTYPPLPKMHPNL